MWTAEAVAGRHAGNVDIVLDGDGDAVEWSQARVASSPSGGALGLGLRALLAQGEVAVERPTNSRGALQIDVEQVQRIKFARFNAARQLGYRQKRHLVHGTLRIGR